MNLWIVLTGWIAGAGLVGVFAWVKITIAKRVARKRRLEIAWGHGRISGRVMKQMGHACPNAWPSTDPELEAFNSGARAGWQEAAREIARAERWVVEEAERITRSGAAGGG